MTDYVRTEDDIVAQRPIKVKLGEQEYDIPILKILAAREWRAKFITEAQSIATEIGSDAGPSEAFANGLAFVFLRFPEKIADLVFSYASKLPRAKIEDEATEEQLAKAFGQIVQVAFPFVGELRMVTTTLGSIAASIPRSARSTKSPSQSGG